ncbi:MAG: response regulator [Lysobacter sp.]|nr:response regulator [Lysobacter sp.]
MTETHPVFPGATNVHRLLQAPEFQLPGLGPVAQWPAALRVMLGMMLDSQQPMSLAWGTEGRLLYNAPYSESLGDRHPAAFGQRFGDVWPEYRSELEPLVRRAMAGEGIRRQDVPIRISRHGKSTQCWFTIFHSPARDENGQIRGMYTSIMETTARVLSEKRQSLLLSLDDRFKHIAEPERVLATAREVLAEFWEVDEYACLSRQGHSDMQARVDRDSKGQLIARLLSGPRVSQEIEALFSPRSMPMHRVIDDPGNAGLATRAAPFAALAIPVRPQHWQDAVLLFASTHSSRWSGEDMTFMQEVARRTASAIDYLVAENNLRDLNQTLEQRVTERTTELHEAREKALGLARRLQLTLEAAQVGDWDLDLVTDEAHRSLRHDQCFGYSEPIPCWGFDTFIGHVHPEDRQPVIRAFEQALDGLGDCHVECRVVWPDGSIHWIAAHGSVYSFSGKPKRMAGIVVDITERKEAEEELRNASHRKDEFLAMLAHELRNPLAPIGTAAQLLQMAPGDEGRVRNASEIIARQVSHMTTLVDDLLDVSRLSRGLVELRRKPLDLRSVMTAAVEQVRPLIESRRHALTIWIGPDPIPVTGDHPRLIQVIANLLNNAAKYTAPGGQIELKVRRGPEDVTVVVTDNGSGIDSALLPEIFELFSQGKRTPDRQQGGLGIGLALARSIAELHGGSIAASSAGSGCGSAFSLSLPLSHEAPVTETMGGAVAECPERSAGTRVLVVDDNVDAATTIAELLRVEGHQVFVAHEARTALELAWNEAPLDAFVLDIGLPDMTGHELLAAIREQTLRPALFIALTGYGQAHDLVQSKAAGFQHHLIKPVDATKLISILAAGLTSPG